MIINDKGGEAGLSYLFNDTYNNFNESRCHRNRRRPKSYVMATSSGSALSASDDSIVIQNASSSPDIK
ncbi:unnamed protein product [Wuchereria bancrofti]|uniref:Uncharacterized protein n=1 Tax=Wuchereria bancrofti TaxID=6293 RepID=A0A3P7DV77_WUCBA|nr:unnamed protein product [Wuchereria bancrofti]